MFNNFCVSSPIVIFPSDVELTMASSFGTLNNGCVEIQNDTIEVRENKKLI